VMLTASLPVLLSSPTAVVASLLLFLVALEAHRMLRAALRQRRKGKYAMKFARALQKTVEISDSTPKKHVLEAPVAKEKPTSEAQAFPDLPFQSQQLVELPGKKVSLLPVAGDRDKNENTLAPMNRPAPPKVPAARLTSCEERLAGAIKAAIAVKKSPVKAQSPSRLIVQPLDVLAELRSSAKERVSKKVSFGCGRILGTRVTLIDHLPEVSSSTPGPLLMPSRTTDLQAKFLIGEAVKVLRCSECTRPLPPGLTTSPICNRCSRDHSSKENETMELETGWAPVISRRRRRSEKAKKSKAASRNSSRRRTRSEKSSTRSSEKGSSGRSKPQRRRSSKVPTTRK